MSSTRAIKACGAGGSGIVGRVLGGLAFTRFAGSIDTLALLPGAHAPGFTLMSAPRTEASMNQSLGARIRVTSKRRFCQTFASRFVRMKESLLG